MSMKSKSLTALGIFTAAAGVTASVYTGNIGYSLAGTMWGAFMAASAQLVDLMPSSRQARVEADFRRNLITTIEPNEP